MMNIEKWIIQTKIRPLSWTDFCLRRVDKKDAVYFCCFFFLSIVKQIMFVINATIFKIKKTTNKVLGCWSIDITDQYIAPITVIKETIQKKLLSFSIIYSLSEKSHIHHSSNGQYWNKGGEHSNNNVNIIFFHSNTAFLILL